MRGESMLKKFNLLDLKPGEEAVISGFNNDFGDMDRLRDLGLSDGASVRFIKYAPFGDPIEIMIRGFHLSIHKSIAENILIIKDEGIQ